MSWKTTLIRTASRGVMVLKKHAPEILTGVGIVSGVAATGFAVKSTMEADKIIENHNAMMKKIEMAKTIVEKEPELGYEYTENNQDADRQAVYMKTAMEYVKLYAPTIGLTVLSIASILTAHSILSRRYTAVAAAFATTLTQFNAYRERVRNEVGEEREYDLYNDVVTAEVTDEDGTVTETRTPNLDTSTMDRYFDESSYIWDSQNPEMNVNQLRTIIARANDMLDRDGHLFLNDVYRLLGLDDTPEGSVCGWIWNEEKREHYVDFGVFNGTDDPWDFANRCEWDGKNGILLHFNINGVIYNLI